jgi:hypothetical protein
MDAYQAFEQLCLSRVTPCHEPDSAPDFSHHDYACENALAGDVRKPRHHTRMSVAATFEFRHYIGIHKHVHRSISRGRASIGSLRSRPICLMACSHRASPSGDSGSFIAKTSNAVRGVAEFEIEAKMNAKPPHAASPRRTILLHFAADARIRSALSRPSTRFGRQCSRSLCRSITSLSYGGCKAAPGEHQSFQSVSRHGDNGFSALRPQYDPRDWAPITVRRKTDPESARELSDPRTLEEAPGGQGP